MFMTEKERLKIVAQLQTKLNRQLEAYKSTEAQLNYWAQLELPLPPDKKAR